MFEKSTKRVDHTKGPCRESLIYGHIAGEAVQQVVFKTKMVVNDGKALKQNELNTLINVNHRRILSNEMGIIIKT